MGAIFSGADMVNEVLSRVQQNFSTGRALYFVNRAVRYFDGVASYSFNAKTGSVSYATGQTSQPAPVDLDSGKDIYAYVVTLAGNLMPVKRVELNEYGINAVYQPAPFGPSHYTIVGASSGANVPSLLVYPPISGGFTLSLVYHVPPALIANSGTAYSNFPDAFDDIIVDWAEAEIKRIYKMAGAMEIFARVEKQLASLVDQYRTNTKLAEGLAAEARKAQERSLEKT